METVRFTEKHLKQDLPKVVLDQVEKKLDKDNGTVLAWVYAYEKWDSNAYVLRMNVMWNDVGDFGDAAVLFVNGSAHILYLTYDDITDVRFSQSGKSVIVDCREIRSGTGLHYQDLYKLSGARRERR